MNTNAISNQIQDYIRKIEKASTITARKKWADELSTCIKRDDVMEFLNKCGKNGKINWTSIFSAIHSIISIELGKLKDKSHSSIKTYITLVSDVISTANGGTPRIKGSTLVRAIIQVFQNKALLTHVGSSYLKFLLEKVLPFRQYWCCLSEYYMDLFEFCQNMYRNPPPNISKSKLVPTMNLLVKYGCGHSKMALQLKRGIFTFLEHILKEATNDTTFTFQSDVVSLALTVCNKLKNECRLAICNFGEKAIDFILELCKDKSEGINKKKIHFNLMHVLVVAHHPNGVGDESAAIYAVDWEVWRAALRKIYEFIGNGMKEMARDLKNQRLSPTFLKLSVEVTKQIFTLSEIPDGVEHSVKRMKMERECGRILQKMEGAKKPRDNWPWLALLAALLAKYPKVISAQEYLKMTKFASEGLATSKEPMVTNYFFQCCSTLISARDCLFLSSDHKKEESVLLDSILNSILRTVGLNQCVEQSHEFLRKLLPTLRKEGNVNQILKLYVTGAIRLSEQSLKTLHFIRTQRAFPEKIFDVLVGDFMVDWLLPDKIGFTWEVYFSLPPDILAETIVMTVCKSNTKIFREVESVAEFHLDFEQIYFVTAFECLLATGSDEEFTSAGPNSELCIGNCVLNDAAFDMIPSLVFHTGQALVDLSKSDPGDKLKIICACSEFALVLLNMKKYCAIYKVKDDVWTKNKSLFWEIIGAFYGAVESIFKGVLFREMDMLEACNRSRDFYRDVSRLSHTVVGDIVESDEYFQLVPVLTQFVALSKGEAASFYENIGISNAFHLENSADENWQELSLLDSKLLCKFDSIRFAAFEVVMGFCCSCDKTCQKQYETLSSILSTFMSDYTDEMFSDVCNFQMLILLIKTVLEMKKISSEAAISTLKIVIRFITKMCRLANWHKIEEAALLVIQLCKQSILKARELKDEASLKCLFKIMRYFHDGFIPSGLHGPAFTCKMIECLALFVPMREMEFGLGNLFVYAHDDFHRVRLEASRHICPLFAYLETEFDEKATFDLFGMYKDDLEQVFLSEDSQDEDEYVNRCASVLQSVALMVCECVKVRRRSMLWLLQLALKVPARYSRKIFAMVETRLGAKSKRLLADNASYVFWEWFKAYGNFQNFPYEAIGFSRQVEFYEEYAFIMVPIVVNKNTDKCQEIIREISTILNKTTQQLIHAYFPEITAIWIPNQARYESVVEILASNPDQVLKNSLLPILGEDSFRYLLRDRMGEIVTSIFRKFHNPEYYLCEKAVLAEVEPIHLNERQIINIFQRLRDLAMDRESGETELPLLKMFCRENPSFVQEIFKNLYTDVKTASTPEISLASFQKYALFCEFLIMHEAHNCLFAFVTKTAVVDLIRFLSPNPQHFPLFASCAAFLVKTMKKMGESGDVMDLYHTVVGKVTPFTTLLDPIGECAKEMLRDLGQCDQFQSAPNEWEVRESLISLSRDVYPEKKLKILGKLRKNVNAVLNEWKKDTRDNLSILFDLVKDKNESVRLEAAKFLGEVGLVHLSAFAARSRERNPFQFASFVHFALKKSLVLLSDDNVRVFESATRALHAVMNLKEAKTYVNDFNAREREFLKPFDPANNICARNPSVIEGRNYKNEISVFDDDSLWSLEGKSHEEWIVRLVHALLHIFQSSYMDSFEDLCEAKVSFSEAALPYLIHSVLNCKSKGMEQIWPQLNHRMGKFFRNFFEGKGERNENSMRCMLDVVRFWRLKQKESTPQPSRCNRRDLTVNYLHVASAAQFCSSNFASIMYAELWLDSFMMDFVGNESSLLIALTDSDDITEDLKAAFFEILRQAFVNIGDVDAIYGCGNAHLLNDDASRMVYYKHVGDWASVMETADTRLSHDAADFLAINDYIQAMGACGLNYMRHSYVSSCGRDGLSYDSAWRLNSWNCPEPFEEADFNYFRYAALRDIKRGNVEGARLNVDSARCDAIRSLVSPGVECSKTAYEFVSKLQCLQEMEEFTCVDLGAVIKRWKERDMRGTGLSFDLLEPILSQRRCMLADRDDQESFDWKLGVSRMARKEGKYQYASMCLADLKESGSLSDDMRDNMRLEEAVVFWESGRTEIARCILKDMLVKNEKYSDMFLSTLQRIYATWLSKINSISDNEIFNELFEPAAKLAEKCDDPRDLESKVATLRAFSRFADAQYQRITDYQDTHEYKRKSRDMQEIMKALDEFKAKIQKRIAGKTKQEIQNDRQLQDENKAYTYKLSQLKIDDMDLKRTQESKNTYLLAAVRFYTKQLAEMEEDDFVVFRTISLWINNKENEELNGELEEAIQRIPSYKFVPALPQLVAHIVSNAEEKGKFPKILQRLIERCVIEHPHHTLPLLFSLANFSKDAKSSLKSTEEPRVVAAKEYIKKAFESCKIAGITEEMNTMCDLYIKLANYRLDEERNNNRRGGDDIPKVILEKMANLDKIYCPTIQVVVNKSGVYDNVIGIEKLEQKYVVLSGINKPKRIVCICSDGKKRPQLVKGRDDLRQDAVMQQVFGILNTLLARNEETSKRQLSIRTYKITPLSQRTGVMEFCANTTPLGSYLAEAHAIYRPMDMSCEAAKNHLKSVSSSPDREKVHMYEQICSNLKPVMRYFFLERFPDAVEWYERKLSYIHSVATTSIVGYVMGLGDRHSMNMLLDDVTAEIIHIDFGVAFEQGALLSIPEKVPFRMTRDIEDGMGVFSSEGIFKKCCEKTMAILRKNKEIIETTIEVFLYDPLYLWTITPDKANRIQETHTNEKRFEENFHQSARNALRRIKLKLEGLEDGFSVTTIEGQVNRVIQTAKHKENLALIYYGWQPYL